MTANRPVEEPADGDPTPDRLLAGQGRVSPRVVFFTVAALAVIVVVGAMVFSGGTQSDPLPGALENSGDDGDLVPSDSFELFDGSTAAFADFAGKPLVVNFFASWCGPCRAEMPDFQAVHEDLGAEVTFLGFAFQDRAEDAQALVEQTGVTYALATDPGHFQAGFGGIAMPTTAFVNEEGRILDVHSGLLDQDTLRDRIEEHFGISS